MVTQPTVVVVRLVDYEDHYLVGTADSYADVLKLNSVNITNSLSAGYIAPYSLEWMWPMEGDDAYDTLLGNMAEGEELTLTIVIHFLGFGSGIGGAGCVTSGTRTIRALLRLAAAIIGGICHYVVLNWLLCAGHTPPCARIV